MRTRLSTLAYRLLFVAFSAVIFTGAQCGAPTVQQDAVTDSSNGAVAAVETTNFITILNQERAKRGVGAVMSDSTLTSVATQYSTELVASNSSSYNFAVNGQDAATRVRNTGQNFTTLGHIGAIDFTTGQTVINALILNNDFALTYQNYNRVGVGVAKSAGHNYWTIILTN